MINDTPTVAGLNDVSTRLCALPEKLTTPEQRKFFSHMKAAAPVIYVTPEYVDYCMVAHQRIGAEKIAALNHCVATSR